jgi:hypothetical protein
MHAFSNTRTYGDKQKNVPKDKGYNTNACEFIPGQLKDQKPT